MALAFGEHCLWTGDYARNSVDNHWILLEPSNMEIIHPPMPLPYYALNETKDKREQLTWFTLAIGIGGVKIWTQIPLRLKKDFFFPIPLLHTLKVPYF